MAYKVASFKIRVGNCNNSGVIDDQDRTETACGQQAGQNDNSFVIPAKAGIHACRRQACLLQAGSGVAGNSAGSVGIRYSDGHSPLMRECVA